MIKKYLFAALVLTCNCICTMSQENLKLWYKQPAAIWTEALPIGNGRLGAMVFGRVDEELFQLNESSLWSGGHVVKNVNPGAFCKSARGII